MFSYNNVTSSVAEADIGTFLPMYSIKGVSIMVQTTKSLSIIKIAKDIKLSPAEPIYAQEIFTIIQENKEYFSQFMAWPKFVNTVADSLNFLNSAKISHQQGNSKTYIILYKEVVAGVISFNSIDVQNKTAYIGYWLDKKSQGNGIVTKSIAGLIKQYSATGEIKRFVIKCTTENVRSNAVAKLCGFQHEGVLKKAEIINDVSYDQNSYAYVTD